MKSIKSFMVRFKKKGKTKGRPSKSEVYLSQTVSILVETKAFKDAVAKYMEDLIMIGEAKFDFNKVLNQATEEIKNGNV